MPRCTTSAKEVVDACSRLVERFTIKAWIPEFNIVPGNPNGDSYRIVAHPRSIIPA